MRDKQPPADDKPVRKKPNIFVRLLAFLVTLALTFGAVTLVVYRDKLNFDVFRRWFTYRSLERNDSGQAQSFVHGGEVYDRFAAVGDNLLTASSTGYRLFSGSGVKYVDEQAALENPVVSSAGNYGLVYDAGGRSLFVFKNKEEIFSLTLDAGKTLLSARVNPSGWLAVTTQATGYKGSVTVYNADYAPVLRLNLSSSFIMDAVVTADNKSLATITIGQGDAGFQSRFSLYALDRTEEQTEADASCLLGSMVVLDFQESSAGFWALGDSGVALAGKDGAPAGSYDFGGRYLKEFSLGGDDFAVALLGKYRAGTLSDLVVIDAAGTAGVSVPMNEQVLSLSAAGRYIAVLTADRLDIYTSDMTLYSSVEGIQGARKVLMRSDGTALLIASDTARLYVPN